MCVCVCVDPGARGATLDVGVAEALKAPGPDEPASCLSRSRHPRVGELAGWEMSGNRQPPESKMVEGNTLPAQIYTHCKLSKTVCIFRTWQRRGSKGPGAVKKK